jgi:RecJ-like exonuclease
MYKNTECPKCEGLGFIIVKHGDKGKIDTIKQSYRFERIKCSKCDGKGIIKVEIT